MKILIHMKLGDSSLDSHIRPITELDYIDRIIIVRDYPGPIMIKVEYHCPPSIVSRFSILAALYKFFILLYFSIVNRPDLIHAYMLFPHGVLAFVVAKLTRRPISISLISGPVQFYSIGSPLGIKYNLSIPWFGRVFLKILKHCDIITTTGSYTSNFLISHGISKNRIHILPHSVSELKHKPIDIPKIYDVISVGRLSPVKHIEVLLRAISKVKERHQDIRAGIVGDGPCSASLKELSTELDINDNVEFLGFNEDVTYYYNSSRIFILTSEREGFPFSLVEAMMCGLPSIVSNCGDIIDKVKVGYNAIIVQHYDDVEGFADSVIRLLEDKELYHRLSHNALKTVKELSVEVVTQEWNKIFRNLRGDANYHKYTAS